jgi:hypothetical protein
MFSELPFFFPNYAFRIYSNEDRGIIFADVTLPPGSTLEHGKYCEGIRLYN